ncbi:uncharacterized protein VTP21DRAFT_5420 [Calcarisporiella thermophila]|uniref:uncharacterized protein n=1 Tax=Calcarisporiella thermophila TaxID=911321 RepID=UPI00374209DB
MSVYNSIFQTFHGIREYLSPVLKNSKFKETGCVTPEEFVAAGDFLVYKCPTWSWEKGEAKKRRDYLPPEKQFLVTRNVPCLKRVRQMEYTDEDAETQLEAEDGADSWLFTHSSRTTSNIEELAQNIDEEEEDRAVEHAAAQMRHLQIHSEDGPTDEVEEEIPDMDDIPDIGDDEDVGAMEENDPATLQTTQIQPGTSEEGARGGNILQVRTYDVFITYDKYYQTPRVWLFGYDEHRRPLTSAQIFEDVSQDYAKKTVTIESHPHLNMSLASIHPCRHAQVMKKIIEKLNEESGQKGEEETIRVDQYMIIFLKFVSSVVPTIDYDHTISA